MFSCKVCKEKDARIADLKAQLAHQHALVSSMVAPKYSVLTEQDANYALDGAGRPQIDTKVVPPTPEELTLQQQIEKEAVALITGTYN